MAIIRFDCSDVNYAPRERKKLEFIILSMSGKVKLNERKKQRREKERKKISKKGKEKKRKREQIKK